MASPDPVEFRLTVLNPGGRDPEQHFPDGAGEPGGLHQPTSFHAYAACTRGSFHRETKQATMEATPVLLLLRRNFTAAERALSALRSDGRTVAVSLKETGLHQIAHQLSDPARIARFLRIVRAADGCIAATPEAAHLYRAIRDSPEHVAFIPTPYPMEDSRWDFSRPIDERSGIFVGTREWDVPSRNHFGALIVAKQMSADTGEPVTVFNFDRRKGARFLTEIGFVPGKLRVLDRQLSYPDYLREIAGHKIVFQLDTSFVPGQVAGDALLCRVPCVGGNGAIDRVAFPKTCGHGHSIEEIAQTGVRLLRDRAFYEEILSDMQRHAETGLRFSVGAKLLQEFFERLPFTPSNS